ncbi:MAG: cupin domain-containing protein, partial [Chloroflexi bacterium]|nr:cupin domain-containing protein [Chloroflexota bacterium]
ENAKRSNQAGNGRDRFNLTNAEAFEIGPHYSTSRGAPVRGEKVQVVLVTKPKGTGARLHTHANEQFNLVLQGRLRFHVQGVEGVAGPGELIYIPANARHWTRASEDEDVIFYASKDTSYDISGDAVDGTKSGPYYSPGFEPKED